MLDQPIKNSMVVDAHELTDFDASTYIKEIGRGPDNARSLSREQMFDLFSAMLQGRVHDVSLGAVMMALRTKGESTTEIAGALDAVQTHSFRLGLDNDRPCVSIASYNGARLNANLTPLLACLLARQGLNVVVHGLDVVSGRTTTSQIMRALNLHGEQDLTQEQMRHQLDQRLPVFMRTETICVGLRQMLDLRSIMGVRNISHTIAKMMNPFSCNSALRLVSFTHPEFNERQTEYFTTYGGHALIMRATEGEVVASTKRAAKIQWIKEGVSRTLRAAQSNVMNAPLGLPTFNDAMATADWIQSVLAGKTAVPLAIADQVQAILEASEK
jgi:anthranilate phosphoribosyltransferase